MFMSSADKQRRTNSYEILVRVEVSAGVKYHIETLYLQSGSDRSTPVYFSMFIVLSCSLSLLYCISDILYGFSNK